LLIFILSIIPFAEFVSKVFGFRIKKMKLQIKKSEPENIPQILSMIKEFADFENLTAYCRVTEKNLCDVLCGDDSFAESLVVFADETPIAYAIFFPHFSSFKGQRSVYLEDIYIKPEFRRCGIGEKMLRKIAEIGKTQNASRIDFQVLKSNEKAINFYKKLGAVCNEDETHFKFDDEAFQNLAT
jgi:GNAT superfamily N-acetyltransferase